MYQRVNFSHTNRFVYISFQKYITSQEKCFSIIIGIPQTPNLLGPYQFIFPDFSFCTGIKSKEGTRPLVLMTQVFFKCHFFFHTCFFVFLSLDPVPNPTHPILLRHALISVPCSSILPYFSCNHLLAFAAPTAMFALLSSTAGLHLPL